MFDDKDVLAFHNNIDLVFDDNDSLMITMTLHLVTTVTVLHHNSDFALADKMYLIKIVSLHLMIIVILHLMKATTL